MKRIQGELIDFRNTLNPQLTDIVLARFAGLFIGEGNIHLVSWKGSFSWRVTIAMTHADDIMADLKRLFGGTVTEIYDGNPNHTPCLYWKTSNRKAIAFLRAIFPFLEYKLKKEEAKIFISSFEEYRQLSNGAGHRLPQRAITIAKEAKNAIESYRSPRGRKQNETKKGGETE